MGKGIQKLSLICAMSVLTTGCFWEDSDTANAHYAQSLEYLRSTLQANPGDNRVHSDLKKVISHKQRFSGSDEVDIQVREAEELLKR